MKETYFGGKGADGVYQTIINNIPPHDVWLCGFAGHCAVTRHKKKAIRNILWDLDAKVIDYWRTKDLFLVKQGDCIAEIQHYARTAAYLSSSVYTYFDPPYLHDVRTSSKRYRYELTVQQHEALIALASRLPGMVGISHYPHPMYDALLDKGWRRITYTAQTRQGGRTEAFYMNYPEHTELHDYRFLGDNFRARESIKRRQKTILGKIESLDESEKLAVLELITDKYFTSLLRPSP